MEGRKRMLTFSKRFFWAFMVVALLPVGLAAQTTVNNFVYTNNDLKAGNSVSVFSVSTDGTGTLTPITAFLTGGLGSGGGSYSPNRIIVVKGASNDFLYASNSGSDSTHSNSVSGFTINPSSGALASTGPPVDTAGVNLIAPNIPSGISLAATPDGHYLYAGTTDGTITVFSINSTSGVLSSVGSSSADGPMYSMKVSPNGRFLVLPVYSPSSNPSTPYGLDVFTINAKDGTLSPASGSPFMFSSVAVTGLDINCASSLVFAGRTGSEIDVISIDSSGKLTETNPPFSTSASSNQVVVLSADDSTLFSSNQGNENSNFQYTVTAFSVDPTNGTLSSPITAGAGSSAFYTGGLAVGQLGSGLLYSSDTNAYVTSFGVGGGSTIQYDDSASTGQLSGMHSVAAYPAKACPNSPTTSGLVASLQISGSSPPGFDLEATLSLDPSLVVDPLTQALTIQVGSYEIDLPAGSFKSFHNGAHSGVYLFQGVVNSTTLKVQITPLGENQFQISAYDKQIDLTGLSSPVTVTVGIGDNSASASVTPNLAGPLRGNWQGQ
jgi:6-phosphogluconolactonase (cycloisomerase 2 family)